MTYDSSYEEFLKRPHAFGNGHADPEDELGPTEKRTTVLNGREFILEADGQWRDEDGRILTVRAEMPHISRPAPDRYRIRARDYQGMNLGDQGWFMYEWIPTGQTTGLYGIPGVRKSLWILQALIAGAIGTEFCGIHILPGPVLGLFAEDTANEIGRRARKILHFYGARDFGDPGMDANFNVSSLVGITRTEFISFSRSGRALFSPEWEHFEEEVLDLKPRLVALDVAPHFFGGNENNRREVHTFIRVMDSLGQRANTAMLLSVHPSVRGMQTKTLASGSTGWEGGMRARLGLFDPTHLDQEDEDEQPIMRAFSAQRTLIRFKSNYAKEGEEIPLEIRDNAYFEATDAAKPSILGSGPLREIALETKFWELFDSVTAIGETLTNNPQSPRHAARVFARHPQRGPFTKVDFERAMRRFLYSKPPSLKLTGTGKIKDLARA